MGILAGWRRWVRGDVLLAAVAIGAGAGGALLTGRYVTARIDNAEAMLARRYQTTNVLVTSADLRKGSVLGQDNLALRRIPREYLPPDAVTAERAGRLLGSRLAVDMARGMPVALSVLGAEQPEGLSTVLAASERALTLSVDELNSQAGALRAGDRVDLYYGRRDDGDALLVPLLQMIEILAVGDSFGATAANAGAPGSFATVTLRVQSADAPRVLLAQQAGEVSLLLRARGDDALQAARIHNSRELLNTAPVRIAQPGVEVLTGGQGGAAPARTWLRVGNGVTGEAS